MERDAVIGSFVVLAIDRRTIDELAVDVDLAVRPIKSPYADLRMARLLGRRDGRQSLRGRALFRSLEGDDARFVVVDNGNFCSSIVLALQVDELRLFYLIICSAF